MKNLLALLLCLMAYFASYGQSEYRIVDTQYQRTDDTYNAYTIFFNPDKKNWLIEIVTSSPIQYISSIKLINRNKEIKLKGKPEKSLHPVDNENWKTFNFSIEANSFNPDDTYNCQLYLKFYTTDKKYSFQLPLNHLLLKRIKTQ